MAEHGVSCRGACWSLSFGTAGASVVAITGMMAYRHGFEFFVTRLLRPEGPGPGPGFARERGTASLGQVAAPPGSPSRRSARSRPAASRYRRSLRRRGRRARPVAGRAVRQVRRTV
jgi:hypothetical protein